MKNSKLVFFGVVLILASFIAFGVNLGFSSKHGKTAQEYPSIDFTADFDFPGDWGDVPTTEVIAFYPGQSSWQWLESEAHPGSTRLAQGMGCRSCHEGKEQALGESLVKGRELEPTPIEGKAGSKVLKLQAAYDEQYFYLRAEWESERPGITHGIYRFDASKGEWIRASKNKPYPLEENEFYSYEDRLGLIIDDQNIAVYEGAEVGVKEVGCWVVCHSSMREMPERPSAEEVKGHPYLGEQNLGEDDIRKYLLKTRYELDEAGGWDKVDSEKVEQMFKDGQFLDLIQFRGARSAPMYSASNDYVLEYRFSGVSGVNSWINQDPPYGEKDWMYDREETGFNFFPEEKFKAGEIDQYPLYTEGPKQNWAPYDPETEVSDGDMLPRRILREATGSRGAVDAYSKWEDGKWTVTLVRELDTGYPDDKVLSEVNVYNVGFGLFDDHVSNRFHYVTMPLTMGLGDVEADIQAVRIE